MSPLDFATIFFVNLDDTIVAIATPPGRGGIGIVRLAGPEARAIAMPMLLLKHDLEPGRAIFGEVIEPGSSGADRASASLTAGLARDMNSAEIGYASVNEQAGDALISVAPQTARDRKSTRLNSSH